MDQCDLHATTFGGGSLACAVARRTLELIDEPLLRHVREMGEHVAARLSVHVGDGGMLREVRGRGLMWAIELASPTRGLASAVTLGLPNAAARRLLAHWVALRLLEKGFLTETPSHDENVLRVEPALIIDRSEIDQFADALGETLQENERFLRFARAAGARLIQQFSNKGQLP
jgi:4-aminobutyrate aminotransferase-like enzyme